MSSATAVIPSGTVDIIGAPKGKEGKGSSFKGSALEQEMSSALAEFRSAEHIAFDAELESITWIPFHKIHQNPMRPPIPEVPLQEAKLKELEASHHVHGRWSPFVCRPHTDKALAEDGHVQIAFGHHGRGACERLADAGKAPFETEEKIARGLPCVIRPYNDKQMLTLFYDENGERSKEMPSLYVAHEYLTAQRFLSENASVLENIVLAALPQDASDEQRKRLLTMANKAVSPAHVAAFRGWNRLMAERVARGIANSADYTYAEDGETLIKGTRPLDKTFPIGQTFRAAQGALKAYNKACAVARRMAKGHAPPGPSANNITPDDQAELDDIDKRLAAVGAGTGSDSNDDVSVPEAKEDINEMLLKDSELVLGCARNIYLSHDTQVTAEDIGPGTDGAIVNLFCALKILGFVVSNIKTLQNKATGRTKIIVDEMNKLMK